MLQRNVPDGEGLKFGVTCRNAPLVFVVKLGKAGGHFSAAGAWSCDDNQGTFGFDIIIFSVAFITDNERNIGWIAGNGIVDINRKS